MVNNQQVFPNTRPWYTFQYYGGGIKFTSTNIKVIDFIKIIDIKPYGQKTYLTRYKGALFFQIQRCRLVEVFVPPVLILLIVSTTSYKS